MTPVSGSPWWAGVSPVEVTIDCQGRAHRLRWEAGELTTPDHPDADRRAPVQEGDRPRSAHQHVAEDLDSGGCVTVARGWQAFRSDPRVLVLARRHPGETLDRGWADASGDPLARVLATLEPGLERRLQLEVATRLAEPGTGAGQAPPRAGQVPPPAGQVPPLAGQRGQLGQRSETTILEAAAVGRLTKALDRWLGPRHQSAIRLAARSKVAEVEGTAMISLAPSWLGQVWGRYLTLVDGFLVLEVNRVVEDRAEVIGVGRPGGEASRLTLKGPAPWRAVDRQPLSPDAEGSP